MMINLSIKLIDWLVNWKPTLVSLIVETSIYLMNKHELIWKKQVTIIIHQKFLYDDPCIIGISLDLIYLKLWY